MVIATWFVHVRRCRTTPNDSKFSCRRHPLPRRLGYAARMGMEFSHLRTVPLFRGFVDDELAEIAALFQPVTLPAGEALFRVGEDARHLYLLTAGDVLLDRPGDDRYHVHAVALLGELGALTSIPRSTTALPQAGAVLWSLEARTLQTFFADNQELGVRFLVNLLELCADKVSRDQRRLSDMRQNVIRTQKEHKRLRELLDESPETAVSAPLYEALDHMIHTNRRVNYRVSPPPTAPARMHLDAGVADVIELSRTHVTVRWPDRKKPAQEAAWYAGVLEIPGAEMPVSGKIIRANEARTTFELDPMIDPLASQLEGYLTRVQLLDILV